MIFLKNSVDDFPVVAFKETPKAILCGVFYSSFIRRGGGKKENTLSTKKKERKQDLDQEKKKENKISTKKKSKF